MKYMVMECHLSYAVVLDEEGRFLKVANRHYEAGQTVTEVIEMKIPEAAPPKRKIRRIINSAAVIAACLLLAVIPLFLTSQVACASVYMHINPEIRIDVNRKNLVVGLDGVNADGRTLINGYRYQEKNLNLVMEELLDRAIEMGFLQEGGKITLALDSENNQWTLEHGNSLPSSLQEHLKEKLSVTIDVVPIEEIRRTEEKETEHIRESDFDMVDSDENGSDTEERDKDRDSDAEDSSEDWDSDSEDSDGNDSDTEDPDEDSDTGGRHKDSGSDNNDGDRDSDAEDNDEETASGAEDDNEETDSGAEDDNETDEDDT